MADIRKMEPSEAALVKKLAKKSFVGIEQFFVSTPKEAMVALKDNKIVGGIMIKYIITKDQKIGYIDTAFIVPEYQGKGIGGILYEKTVQYLWGQGCTGLSALVKDDNVGSWQLFLNNGFSQTSIAEGVGKLGFLPMLKQYFLTPFFIANGMEFYLTVKNKEVKPKKSGSIAQIGLYLLVNAVLMLFALVQGETYFLDFLGAYTALLLGRTLFGYVGTLFSKQKWKFRLNSAGAVIVAFINLIGGLFPMIGNWYPAKYENTDAFRKAAGITALCEWCFMLVLTISAIMFQSSFTFLPLFISLGKVYLLYYILAVYPFESYGGRRIYLWNKGIYTILAMLSAFVIIIR